MTKNTEHIYVVGGGVKKDGTLILAHLPSSKEYHPGETVPYNGCEWEVIGELPQ